MNETRLMPDFVFDVWSGIVVPKDVPDVIVERLNSALNEALRQESVRRELAATGGLPASPMSAVDAQKFYGAEIARYRAIGKAINLHPE